MSRLADPSLLDGAVERAVLDGHDGRSGAALERVLLDDGTRLVVKRARPGADLTMQLSGDSEGRELVLWATGVLDHLPDGVGHAVVGGWRDGADVVIAMRDLGGAVLGWDTVLGRDDCRRIFEAAAALHAAFAGRRIEGLCPLSTRLSIFDPAGLRSLPLDGHPIAGSALRGWERFAELVPAAVADAVAALHRDPAPLVRALTARGTTLVHGDLWLVNAAFEPGRVTLLDWNLATEAPGAFDFTTFLMGASGVGATSDELLDDVRAAQGDRHDETALRLALLASVVDLGWNKALDAADHDDADIRARAAAELAWWADQARRTLDLGLL
ncbi:MAG: hypothetical protein ACRDZ7_21630 [Acidimicrobiia bacterium]